MMVLMRAMGRVITPKELAVATGGRLCFVPLREATDRIHPTRRRLVRATIPARHQIMDLVAVPAFHRLITDTVGNQSKLERKGDRHG